MLINIFFVVAIFVFYAFLDAFYPKSVRSQTNIQIA